MNNDMPKDIKDKKAMMDWLAPFMDKNNSKKSFNQKPSKKVKKQRKSVKLARRKNRKRK